MNVIVNVFDRNYPYLVKSDAKIKQIYSNVARELGLEDESLFGLMAFNEAEQCPAWLNSSDRVMDVIYKGFHFKPDMRLYLRAHFFPDNFEVAKKFPATMEVLYKQVCERWYYGYKADSSIEFLLYTLNLLATHGPIEKLKVDEAKFEAIVDQIKEDMLKSSHDDKDSNLVLWRVVLQLWKLLGNMSREEAIFNYMNVIASTGLPYETIRYYVKERQYEEQKLCDFDVDFRGIIIHHVEDDESDQAKCRLLPWCNLRKIHKRSASLLIQVFDEDLTELKYSCTSKYEADKLHKLIKSYHEVGRTQKRSSGRKNEPISLPNAQIQLELSNLDHILNSIILQLKKQMQQVLSEPGKVEVEVGVNKTSSPVDEPKSNATAIDQLNSIDEEFRRWMNANLDEVTHPIDDETKLALFNSISELYAMASVVYELVTVPNALESHLHPIPVDVEAETLPQQVEDELVYDFPTAMGTEELKESSSVNSEDEFFQTVVEPTPIEASPPSSQVNNEEDAERVDIEQNIEDSVTEEVANYEPLQKPSETDEVTNYKPLQETNEIEEVVNSEPLQEPIETEAEPEIELEKEAVISEDEESKKDQEVSEADELISDETDLMQILPDLAKELGMASPNSIESYANPPNYLKIQKALLKMCESTAKESESMNSSEQIENSKQKQTQRVNHSFGSGGSPLEIDGPTDKPVQMTEATPTVYVAELKVKKEEPSKQTSLDDESARRKRFAKLRLSMFEH